MPAQKRPLPPENHDNGGGEGSSRQKKPCRLPARFIAALRLLDDDGDADEDYEGIDPKDLPEFIPVDLAEVRKDVQCAKCLWIIKKTRTVMGCMHRFCRECIEKSIEQNRACPACRLGCASRLSLREDHNYDELKSESYSKILKSMKLRSFVYLKRRKHAMSRNEIKGTDQRLSWGGGGARSHTRHGIASGSKGTTRLNRLVNHLENTQVNDNKVWPSSSHSHAETTLTSPEGWSVKRIAGDICTVESQKGLVRAASSRTVISLF